MPATLVRILTGVTSTSVPPPPTVRPLLPISVADAPPARPVTVAVPAVQPAEIAVIATPPADLMTVFGAPTSSGIARSGPPPSVKPPMPYTFATPSIARLPPTWFGVAPVNVLPAFLVTNTWIAVSGAAAEVGSVVVNCPLNAVPALRLALRLLVAVPVAPAPGKLAVGSVPRTNENEELARGAAEA